MNVVRATALALAMLVAPECQAVGESTPADGNSNTIENGEDALISRLRPVLLAAHSAARVYFRAACTSREGHVLFPQIDVFGSDGAKSDIAGTIRKMLRANSDVRISKGENIVRIRIGNVPDTILRVRISLLELTPEEQYNSVLAIGAIQRIPEVKGLRERYGITTPIVVVTGFMNPTDKRLPHLPPTLRDITVDHALDLVAKTFGQVVSYGHCVRERRYYIKDFDIDVDDSDINAVGSGTPK